MRVDGESEGPAPRCFFLFTSELQALLLLQFNEHKSISLETLVEATGLSRLHACVHACMHVLGDWAHALRHASTHASINKSEPDSGLCEL